MDPVYGRFIFSKFDRVKFDRDGWKYAVPETVAENFAHEYKNLNILDAYAGLGNISITLSLSDNTVTAAEAHPRRFLYLKHNAKIYGAAANISFWRGDVEKLLTSRPAKFDLIYLDPPWADLESRGIKYYLDIFSQFAPELVFKVPKMMDNSYIFSFGANQIREVFINHTLFCKEVGFEKQSAVKNQVSQKFLEIPEMLYMFG